MIRQSLSASSLAKNVTLSNAGMPKWFRLIRLGTRFTAAASDDGLTWSTAASVIIAMETTAQAGLAVTSHGDGVLTSAAFDALSIER